MPASAPLRRPWSPALASAAARAVLPWAVILAGCEGPQSAFVSAGRENAEVMRLFWIMAGGATVVWLIIIGIAVYASVGRPGPHAEGKVRLFLIGGGIVFPTVVLAALSVYGLGLLAKDGGPAQHRIVVKGERWWWRLQYHVPGHGPVPAANEIALPLGERVVFELHSDNVIHSLWIPALAGKRDLIPGRINHLVVQADKLGVYRGQCAEYCGTSHAHMGLYAEVMAPADFQRWLQHQASPARSPESGEARRGADLFANRGCPACHQVRGTSARGSIGPDLTHVGSRRSIAAARLPRNHAALAQWIAQTQRLKPDAQMPPFPLPPDELNAIAAYLDQLR